MDDETVLVTGGAGFIGSNLAAHLAEANDVIAVDDCYLGTPENLPDSVRFVEQSVLDDDLPTDVDVVFHLAALSSRGIVESNPVEGTEVNVDGFVNVVEQALDDGCDTFVYASTSSIYDDELSSSEDEAVTANTGYEATMLARERFGEYYNSFYEDVTAAGMRFFSIYQGYGGAESHKGQYANTVSQWAAKMADGERPVLWGDGSQTRDYTHVDDVVRALELTADNQLSGVFNVGAERSFSFDETVTLLNETLGTDIEPEYEPIPLKHYNYQQRADASKLRDATGWEAEIDFEDGIEDVCAPYLD